MTGGRDRDAAPPSWAAAGDQWSCHCARGANSSSIRKPCRSTERWTAVSTTTPVPAALSSPIQLLNPPVLPLCQVVLRPWCSRVIQAAPMPTRGANFAVGSSAEMPGDVRSRREQRRLPAPRHTSREGEGRVSGTRRGFPGSSVLGKRAVPLAIKFHSCVSAVCGALPARGDAAPISTS